MSRHNNTKPLEQEIETLRPQFDELDRTGRQRQKENPHGLVEIPQRLQNKLINNSVLSLLNLFLNVQQDPNLRHPGILFMAKEAFAIHNKEVNELLGYLIEQDEKQGVEVRKKIPMLFNKLARWHDNVKPYFDKFAAIRAGGFKHPGIIRHYFSLDELDSSFAIYKTVNALLNAILEVVDPENNPTTTPPSSTLRAVAAIPVADQRSNKLAWPVYAQIDAGKAKESFVKAIARVRTLNENELKDGIAYHDTLAKVELTGKIGDFYLNLDLDTKVPFKLFKQKFNLLLNLRIKLGGNLIPCGDNDNLCQKIDKFLEISQEFVNEVKRWREFLEEDVQGISRQLGELQGLIVKYIKDEGDREQLEKEILGYQSGIHAVRSSFQALGMLGGLVGSSSLIKVSLFGQQAVEIATMLTSLGVIKATSFAPLSVLGPYAAIAMAGMNIISMFTGGFSKDSSAMRAISQQLNHVIDSLEHIQENQAIIIGNQRIIGEYLHMLGTVLTNGLAELENLIENKFLQLNDNLDRHFDELMLFMNKMKRGLYSRAAANYFLETMKAIRFIIFYSANYPTPTDSSRAALQERMATLAAYDAPELVCHAMLTHGDEQEPDKFTTKTILEILGRRDESISWKLGYLVDYYKTMVDPEYDAGLVCNIELWHQIVIAYAEGLLHLTHEQLPTEQAVDRIRDVGVRTENMIRHIQRNGYTLFIERLFSYLIANTDDIAHLFEHLSREQLQKAVAPYRERLKEKKAQMESYYREVERSSFMEPYKSAFLGQVAASIHRLDALYHEPVVEISPTLFSIYENKKDITLMNPFFAPIMSNVPSILAEASFFGLGYFSGKITVIRLGIISSYLVELYYTGQSGVTELVAHLRYIMSRGRRFVDIPHYPWNDENIHTEIVEAPYTINPESDFVKSIRASVARVISQLIKDVISGEAGELYNLFVERIAAGMLLTGNYARIVGLSGNYTEAIEEFDHERIQSAVYTYLAHAIKAGNKPVEYDLKAELRKIMAFVEREPKELFSPIDPEMDVVYEHPEHGTPVLIDEENLISPLQVTLLKNATDPIQNLTSSLNATIQAALAQLEIAQTRARMSRLGVGMEQDIINITLSPVTLLHPGTTPSSSSSSETVQVTEKSSHNTGWYIATGVAGTLIAGIGLFMFLRNRKLGTNTQAIGVAAALIVNDDIGYAEAKAPLDEKTPSNRVPEGTHSSIVLPDISHSSSSHESETRQTRSDCQAALFADRVPVPACRSTEMDSLVFASSEYSPAALSSGLETVTKEADFTVDPESCRPIEFAGRGALACAGRSRSNQKAQYVFMPNVTPPFFVQCCERLPGVLVLLQFGLEWYRNDTLDSSSLSTPDDVAEAHPATRDAIETLRKQVLTLQEHLTTHRNAKQVQDLKFVLQEYQYTLEDWLSAQERPSQTRVDEFEDDLKEIRAEFSAIKNQSIHKTTATRVIAGDLQQDIPRQTQDWIGVFFSFPRRSPTLPANADISTVSCQR